MGYKTIDKLVKNNDHILHDIITQLDCLTYS